MCVVLKEGSGAWGAEQNILWSKERVSVEDRRVGSGSRYSCGGDESAFVEECAHVW